MIPALANLRDDILAALRAAQSPEEVDRIRRETIGRNGCVTLLLRHFAVTMRQTRDVTSDETY